MISVEFLLCKSTLKFRPLADAIDYLQDVDASHIAIKLGPWIIDATSKRVKLSLYRDWVKDYKIVDKVTSTFKTDLESFLFWYMKYKGIKYGYLQIIGILFIILGIIKNNPFGRDNKALICGELALLYIRDHDKIDLEDLDNYDLDRSWRIIEKYRK